MVAFSALIWVGGCASSSTDQPDANPPPAPKIDQLKPGIVLPNTLLVIKGSNFSETATHELHLQGPLVSASGGTRSISVVLPAKQVTVQRSEIQLDDSTFSKIGEGDFQGVIFMRSKNAWGTTKGNEVKIALKLKRHLVPTVNGVGSGIAHLNSEIPLNGVGFLLGGKEGQTKAHLKGCFLESGKTGSCAAEGVMVDTQLPVQPATETDRHHASFTFIPKLCGVRPGEFKGTLAISNEHGDGNKQPGNTISATFSLEKTRIYRLDQKAASLGQYLDIRGAGFVGGAAGGSTLIGFSGTFTPSGSSASKVSFDLVPKFESGGLARYVLEEKIGIGSAVNLRSHTGTLSGTWLPTVFWGKDQVKGQGIILSVKVAPVRQVVWIRFAKSWTEELRSFGLLAADAKIRQRIMAVLRRDYEGINIDFRDQEPKDFKLYAKLDIGGKDPNGLGLLGYDNTPGKDTDNKRLYDWLGGVNALTQQDGYPGYGGVFLESLLGFSEHPPEGVMKSPLHSPLFDKIFDPFRPDKGTSMTSAEALGAPELKSSAGCPAKSRLDQAACAVRVLGNIIGSTATHELGHSLGLADPYGLPTQFHNPGDRPERLMDAGRDRPFDERAELGGKGPAVFCKEEYQYLKKILPLEKPADPQVTRPSCY